MTNASPPALRRYRRLAAAGLALAGLLGAVLLAAAAAQASQAAHPAAAPGATALQVIHLVAHEQQRKFLSEGGFGDEGIFGGILDNAAGTTQVGIFAGTLTSISANDSLNLATVDLQLPGGQITVQGFADFTQPRLIHAITGGTGRYTGADGEFSLTFPSPRVLDMTLTLQPQPRPVHQPAPPTRQQARGDRRPPPAPARGEYVNGAGGCGFELGTAGSPPAALPGRAEPACGRRTNPPDSATGRRPGHWLDDSAAAVSGWPPPPHAPEESDPDA